MTVAYDTDGSECVFSHLQAEREAHARTREQLAEAKAHPVIGIALDDARRAEAVLRGLRACLDDQTAGDPEYFDDRDMALRRVRVRLDKLEREANRG